MVVIVDKEVDMVFDMPAVIDMVSEKKVGMRDNLVVDNYLDHMVENYMVVDDCLAEVEKAVREKVQQFHLYPIRLQLLHPCYYCAQLKSVKLIHGHDLETFP